MKFELFDVYLVDFKNNIGGELQGKHYAVILSNFSYTDKTILVAPITSKKSGKKYRGGFTINCRDYQQNPSYEKAFVRVNKLREVSTERILGNRIYKLNNLDIDKLIKSFKNVFKFI